MKKLVSFLLLACFSATLFSQTIVSTEPSTRNMILEEFTGKTCGYCPDGHKRAQQLMNQYPGRFFAINVHQGGYAGGTPNYTTPYGNALASQAGMGASGTGYPAGTVSRQAYSGIAVMGASQFLYERTKWASIAASNINESSCLNVAAQGAIDPDTRRLILFVEVYYTANAVESTNKLTVAMLQDNILGPQTGMNLYPEMIVGGLYRHMHMLRDFITGQWGMEVSPTTEGSFWSHVFEYDIPEHFNNIQVVLEDLEFIVFVAENNQTIISGAKANVTLGELTYYTITATAGENGTIDPTGETVCPEGGDKTYTFTPDEYFEVEEVFINEEPMGLAQTTEYTFTELDKDYTIHVTFTLQEGIKIGESTAGENGKILPEGSFYYPVGTQVEYTFIPDEGYEVEEVFINDEPLGLAQATNYTYEVVDSDFTIHVVFCVIQNIKDVNGVAISVAPNPMNDKLFVTGLYNKLEIFSISGQVVTTAYNQPVVDVNHLTKGIYFVKIESNGQTKTFKVIK